MRHEPLSYHEGGDRTLPYRDDMRNYLPGNVVITDGDLIVRRYDNNDPKGRVLLAETRTPCGPACRANGCKWSYEPEFQWLGNGQMKTFPLLDNMMRDNPRYAGLYIINTEHESFVKSRWQLVRKRLDVGQWSEPEELNNWVPWWGDYITTGEDPQWPPP